MQFIALLLFNVLVALAKTEPAHSKIPACLFIKVHSEKHNQCRAYVAHFTQLQSAIDWSSGSTVGMDECRYLWLPASNDFMPLCNENQLKNFKRPIGKAYEVIVLPKTEDFRGYADVESDTYVEYKIIKVLRAIPFDSKKCSKPDTCQSEYAKLP